MSVLSGNRNFEGRINPDVKMNYLASPAAGGRVRAARRAHGRRHRQRAAGHRGDGQPVYLRDIWPTDAEVQEVIRQAIDDDMYARRYADVFAGTRRQNLPTPTGSTFAWDADSTYVRKPPYFDGMPPIRRRSPT